MYIRYSLTDHSLIFMHSPGHRYCPDFTRVTGLSDSVRVAHVGCGGEHTVFVSDDNDVYVAGNYHCHQPTMTVTLSCDDL